ncbi:ABC transporter permease [Halosimplex amylolyticum]|uniref:ABC transporter permease n=1 Tax=Halosimplex amylolyticum TaxID=3396616 RepID=UPI003F56AA76
MVNYYVERIGQAVLTLVSVISLTFVLIRLMPGGPAEFLRAQLIRTQQGSVSETQLNRLVEIYISINPDTPILQQYIDYMTSILTGDFGRSFLYGESVTSVLGSALPWTAFLFSIGLGLTFTSGIVLGAIMAYSEGGRFDVTMSSVATFLNSIPFYVIALLLVYLFGYIWGVFPTSGKYNYDAVSPGLSLAFFASVLYYAILPLVSLVATGFGGWALSMRGNSIQVLGEDYLRVARLRGLPSRRIALRYVGRNAILPLYTGILLSIGFVLGGSVILEQIFQYEGVGYYLFQAIEGRDYPLMMGGFIMLTSATVVGILVADLTYGLIDPRASRGDSRESF